MIENIKPISKAKNISFFIILLQVILQFFMLLFSSNQSLVKIILPVLLVVSILLFFNETKRINSYNFMLIIAMIFWMLIATLAGSGGWGAIINTTILLINLLTISQMEFSKKQAKFLSYLFIIGYLTIILSSYRLYTYYVNDNIFNYFINPNLIGYLTLLFSYFSLNTIELSRKRVKSYRLKVLFIIIFSTYILIETGSRTTLIANLLYIFLHLFRFKNKFSFFSQRKMYKWIKAFIIITFILILSYTYLLPEFFGDQSFVILNKNIFTGRQVIWGEIFSTIKNNWLLGVGTEYAFMDGELYSAHNFLLGVATTFGVPAMLLIIVFFYRVLKYNYIKNYTLNTKYIFYIWISLLFVSIFETVLSYNLVIVFSTLVFIFNVNTLSENKEK